MSTSKIPEMLPALVGQLLTHFRQALAIPPSSFQTHFSLGMTCFGRIGTAPYEPFNFLKMFNEDVNIHGVVIPRGGMTLGVIGSANRDEEVFDNPNELDITREPNKHLSFGQGIHFCLGAPLARLEGQIAINTALRRLSDLRLNRSPDSLRWRPSMILRGLESLPVSFGTTVR